jgi:hypothetical protein
MTPIPETSEDVSRYAAYLPGEPARHVDREALRSRIPGWGADLDPADRPSVPRLQYDPAASGAHWEFPERQPERWPRERSIEHAGLTPVFGTATPPRGLSGALRRHAYARYSEARAAHWLILIAADRVDAWENHAASLASMRPDNPITETGVLAEGSRHGISSRVRERRADLSHMWMDPLVVAGPWVLAAAGAVAAVRVLVRRRA